MPILLGVLLIVALTVFGCIFVIGSIGAHSLLTLRSTRIVEAVLPEPSTPTSIPFRPTISTHPPESGRPINPISPITPVAPTAPSTSEPVFDSSSAVSAETLRTFENAVIPINDPIDLAQRLEGKQNLPTNLDFPVESYQVGAHKTFLVMNSNTKQNFQVQATLGYVTEHVYFWIEEGVPYKEKHLEALVETFERQIYPTNREFFGSEWTPGVDADPHLYILYAKGLGRAVAGYFSSADEYLPIVREDSNGHEMFFLSADHIDLDEEFAYGVLAHEFQHMIQWYHDRNEETWMNEGFSQLAMFVNGYSIGGHDRSYIGSPDIQLTGWYPGSADNTPHYGASFLFITYFLDRFGEGATKALVSDPDNGMLSIDNVLSTLAAIDPLTGEPVRAEDVFSDWVIASFLQDGDIPDGRYTYHNYPNAPRPSLTESLRSCPLEPVYRDVSQYGVDYIGIKCRYDYTLRFETPLPLSVLPAEPHSGSYFYYSNQGDESDMTLTRTFDFTDHVGPLTLSYWAWYDLEKDYDYLYLTASQDGENWQILMTPSGTQEDPSGNSYGWAYNGLSGAGSEPRWIQESLDISQFSGKRVQIRFEYVTDAAVNGEGFLLDDVAVPEIGYFSDFESDDGGWQASGFVRIQNVLPQTFHLAVISVGRSGTKVDKYKIEDNQVADIPLNFSGDTEEVILAISGTTRFTRQKAFYQLSIFP